MLLFLDIVGKKGKDTNGNNNINYRVISGLQIKHVKKVFYKKLNSGIPFLNLLTISYKKNKITLHFSSSSRICNRM